MFLLGVLALIAVLVFVNVSTWLSLRRRKANWAWWVALLGSWLIGGGIGVYGGFFFEYQASIRTRVLGAPIPVIAFQKEIDRDGKEVWIDFVSPVPLLFAVSNVPLLALVVALPFCLIWFFFKPKQRK